MITINMRSAATTVKGQGVGSCYEEQVRLIQENLSDTFDVKINSIKKSKVYHYHTINPTYYIERIFRKKSSTAIGYVHFIPETIEDSLNLPKIAKKIFYKYIISFYNKMDILVAVNPTIIPKLKNYNINCPRLEYIPNYVSEDDFNIESEEKIQQTKEKYGIDKDKFVVMGAGQLQTRKGILDFVEVAKMLPDVQFIWAGGFSFGSLSKGHDEIKEILENPPENMKFLGMIERSDMNSIYNISDLVFIPSYDELFPMVILEALCVSKPLLLRDIDVYPDILFDYYAKGKDNSEFAYLINNLQSDKSSYNNLVEKSKKCHDFYSKEKIVEKWKSLYLEAYREANCVEVLD